MVKNIKYTQHAEKRLEERFISKQDVENAIISQEWKGAFKNRKKVTSSINGKEMEAIFKPENNKLRVITVYWV